MAAVRGSLRQDEPASEGLTPRPLPLICIGYEKKSYQMFRSLR